MKCRSYFVTEDPNSYTCYWCQKSGAGTAVDFSYDSRYEGLAGGERYGWTKE